jgi:Domain of unknown function (DUF4397)
VRKRMLAVGAMVGALAVAGAAVPASAAPSGHHYDHHGDAEVSVLHAVPNTPVDVYVDHKRAIDDFMPGTFVGPLDVRAGTYTVTITAATAKDDSHPVIGPVQVSLKSHRNYTLAAHLTAAGAPTATLYKNDLSKVGRWNGRLVVRHDAAAPAVDVLANGAPIVKNLTNPNEASLTVPAKTYKVAVALAGTTVPVIGPVDLAVTKHQSTIVYAWGSATAKNLAVAVQRLDLRHGWHGSTHFPGAKHHQGHVRW